MYKISHKKVIQGQTSHPLYKTYENMTTRCYNTKGRDYEGYGKRGIKMCDEWRGTQGFMRFVADMGDRPSLAHTVDRIDNDGNYSPENCRWATKRQQVLNTSLRSTNTSGAKGVCWDKRKSMWHARVWLNYKTIHIGYYKDLQEAIKARAQQEEIYS